MQYLAAPPRTARSRATVALFALVATAPLVGCRTAPELGPDPGSDELGQAVARQALATQRPTPPAPPTCGSDVWTTYGHDAARTSASAGCLWGPLHATWTFAPRFAGSTTYGTRAVVAGDAVYVAGAIGPTPSLWRVDVRDGKPLWSYDSHTEAPRGGWPTFDPKLGRVYLVDDGVNGVDAATGEGHRAELDAWGESLSDGERVYAENDWYLDGYGLYLSAFDATNLTLLWRRDYNALVKGVQVPDVGGLAMDDGILVHAAQHGALKGSGLSAFDPKTGVRTWRVLVSPQSAPSIVDGHVFEVERWTGEHEDHLVARKLADGSLLWAQPMPDARGPSPVLAARFAIVHAASGVVAFDQATGARMWEAAIPRTSLPIQSQTTLAAALGSSTLAVISAASVHVLRLDDGSEAWAGKPVPHASKLEAPVIAGRSLYLVADGHVTRLESDPAAAAQDLSLASKP